MKDYLVKALVNQGNFRVYVVKATKLVEEAQKLHHTSPLATEALGESLIATLLLSTSLLKNEEMMTTRLVGNGPLGAIIADGNAQGQVKGYLQNSVPGLAAVDLASAIGNQGMLSVTKDQKLAQPFTGKVGLISSNIAQNYSYYLAKSEQIPAAMGLVVKLNKKNGVTSAGGFLIQALPGTPLNDSEQLSKQLQQLPNLKRIFTKKDTPEIILKKIIPQTNVKFLQTLPVAFNCDCSKQRFIKSLQSLPSSELQSLLEQQQEIETVCRFCGRKYQFSAADLQQIITKK
ncbi:Hsp33 family molecular chaperone HslO [Bombilactobacillus bombi]|uniref:Hsp33 family molecular chaperone HslO n=1 Tax=Bombilactobacillus bombi TaxID=1303590 RepID=UPI0015E5E8F1|nr:Hsp33 family molecular chaperone HslO [Bombilactobacillus bombi]MBA1433809.1 Hsp33 family molecular chaperone HslO [Bombilactobacillus bombi]